MHACMQVRAELASLHSSLLLEREVAAEDAEQARLLGALVKDLKLKLAQATQVGVGMVLRPAMAVWHCFMLNSGAIYSCERCAECNGQVGTLSAIGR